MPSPKGYLPRLFSAMFAYVVVLLGSIYGIQHLPHDSMWRWPLAIAPMLPLVFALLAVTWMFRRIDELQVRIQFEALAFAFAGTAMVTLTVGFLENAGVPRPSWIWVWPVMGVLWALGAYIAQRRFK